ncbi:hypothetical protein HMPREF9071_1382 [Capnocytophaga sp. oral taxon 338 str. F0234]|nr:hypothetical protein HMPREF9071_1382 [Capnocytophaga sp. oral taxon 338 str. F0234]
MYNVNIYDKETTDYSNQQIFVNNEQREHICVKKIVFLPLK